jgi:hypothetical protein
MKETKSLHRVSPQCSTTAINGPPLPASLSFSQLEFPLRPRRVLLHDFRPLPKIEHTQLSPTLKSQR